MSDHEGDRERDDDRLFELGSQLSREPLNPTILPHAGGAGPPPEAFRIVPIEEEGAKGRPPLDRACFSRPPMPQARRHAGQAR